jgi:hypothetical protein
MFTFPCGVLPSFGEWRFSVSARDHAIERTKCSVVVGKLHAVLSSVVTVIVVLSFYQQSAACGLHEPN